MSREINCYHIPRRLSQYGHDFMVERLPDEKGNVFFIEKPDWCKPFESVHLNIDGIDRIYNIMGKGKLYCSIDGIIAQNLLFNSGERADEYKDLEKQLLQIQHEIEDAIDSGTWTKWMRENVEPPKEEE